MKKAIFTALAAGALILAGCTKVETTDIPESRIIQFTDFVTNDVKSIETADDLTMFRVFGAVGENEEDKVFDHGFVSKSENEWHTETTAYWQPGYIYKFAAYSNENTTITEGTDFDYATGHLTISDYTVEQTENGTLDLVYATSDPISTEDWDGTTPMDKVQLTFNHILSMIEFNFTKDETLNGHDITISNIKVNATSNGTFTGTDLTSSQYPFTCWTAATTPAKADYAFDDFMIPSDGIISGSTNERNPDQDPNTSSNTVVPVETSLIMLPQETTDLNVTFTLTWKEILIDGSTGTTDKTKNYTVSLANAAESADDSNKWLPGYHYTYTATIGATNLDLVPIVFDVDVNDGLAGWDDPNDVPVETEDINDNN